MIRGKKVNITKEFLIKEYKIQILRRKYGR